MARHLEFDRAEVVALAAEAFWQTGYEASPALQIADAMGVAKSSLYNTFGSKRNLFIESVDYYAGVQRDKVRAGAKSAKMRVVLRQMLLEVVADNSGGRGCLLVNTATEFGARDDEIRHHVKTGFEGMIDAFAAIICAGQEAGDIDLAVNPHQYAVIVVTGIAGLRVLVKSGFSGDELTPVVDNILAGLA